jgi:hypothetical protein
VSDERGKQQMQEAQVAQQRAVCVRVCVCVCVYVCICVCV